MCRGRAGAVGRKGTPLEGKTMTNNGLNLDESLEAFEERLLERVLPLLAEWLQHANGNNDERVSRIICLQEFPADPLLQESFLDKLCALSGFDDLRLCVGGSAQSCAAGLAAEIEALPSYCLALLWVGADWTLDEICKTSVTPHGIGVRLRSKKQGIALVLHTLHLPYSSTPGANDEVAKGCISALQKLAAPASCLVIAGDFNADIRKVTAPDGFAVACVADSAKYSDGRLTVDGCFASRADSAPAVNDAAESATDRILRCGICTTLAGHSRDFFTSAFIHRDLADDPRLWRVSDLELDALGRYPFADQPRILSKVHAKRAVDSDGGRESVKRSRLQNLLNVDSSDSGEDSSSQS